MKRYRFYPHVSLMHKPRPLKTEIRVMNNNTNFYVCVSVKFTNGNLVFMTFPSKKPFYSALMAKKEIIDDEIKLFNDKKKLKKLGSSYALI